MSARQTILNQVMRFADPADMDVGNWDICTDNILSALRSAGWAVVPVEPTKEMVKAALDYIKADAPCANPHGVYKAMLKAAQEDSRG